MHLSHGIGIYRGMSLLNKHGQTFEHLEIEFDEGTKVYVPTSKIELIQRYVGGTKSRPKLAKIGGQAWVRQKKAAQEAVTDMAVELLELQAQRRSQPGIAFAGDSIWQSQFDASFPYVETPDQHAAIEAVKRDMPNDSPMDRLICGDVGFGKTEVAMRGPSKRLMRLSSGGAGAHHGAGRGNTTRPLRSDWPSFHSISASSVALPPRSTSAKRLAAWRRARSTSWSARIGWLPRMSILQPGPADYDEEQRFGVEMKERLKHIRNNVDVLTLSATPIPRTLHMSLIGVRDISNLETPLKIG